MVVPWSRSLGWRWLRLAAAVATLAWSAPAKERFVYFGTYTDGSSQGIYVSRLETATGKLSGPELAAATPSPCFLAVARNGKYLYAANSQVDIGGRKTGAVSAFAIDPATGHLALLNQKSCDGPGTCHVSVDGEVLLAANYSDGSVKSFHLNRNGGIDADGSYIRHRGTSVNAARQNAPHAHFIQADPSHRFALACDLGADQVVVYRIHPADGTLAGQSVAAVPPGSGARHLAFSGDGRFVHVINEMGCTITTFTWDAAEGTLAPIETVSALPPGVAAQPGYTAAEIRAAGHFVYATIRGHDSVSVLAADRRGRLTFVQNLPAGGQVPRGLGIDPTGRWLLVGNQKTGNVVEFAIDHRTGQLTRTGQELQIGSAVDVEFRGE